MATRFNEHADAHGLLPLRQSAYRANHSTETAITDEHNRFVRNVDRGGHISALVLLDLISAFDTVDHTILRDVLEKRIGIGGMALKSYRSYLSDRMQTFQVGSQDSKNVCRLRQCATRLHPRSTEVHGLYRGYTSGDRMIRHRTSSLR